MKTLLDKLRLSDYKSPYKLAGVIMLVWSMVALLGIAMNSAISSLLYGVMGYVGYNLSIHGKNFNLNRLKLDAMKSVRSLKKIFLSKVL